MAEVDKLETGAAAAAAGASSATAAPAAPAVAATAAEDVKPYKIHVSSRYLDLTKQKLELTRLPHEGAEPSSTDWWEPKPHVEPLIDYWLEKYAWRDQEAILNKLPQFRTAIEVPSSETPLRLHFIHAKSPREDALPLLLIPPFPFTNLSLAHLIQPLTEPEADNGAAADAAPPQAFHVVIPALPGLGFSDPLPNNLDVIATAAEMLNTLMTRLDYPHYLASNAGSASASPAEIDWRLLNRLASAYPGSCVGAHLIAPPLSSPKLQEDLWGWAKWSIASFFHAPILGYSNDDFSALDRNTSVVVPPNAAAPAKKRKKKELTPTSMGLNQLGLSEPNTLAYAMCDSPTGLLVFVMKALRLLAPRARLSPDEIITFTELSWLPGPEYAMRFWAYCVSHPDAGTTEGKAKKGTPKPKVAMTVFLGKEDGEQTAEEEEVHLIPIPHHSDDRYVCPAWGNSKYDVVFSQRSAGAPGLLAWERPEIIAAGIRGLAKALLQADQRLKPATEPATAPLEKVLVKEPTPPAPTQQPGQADEPTTAGGLQPPPPLNLEHRDSSSPTVINTPSPAGDEGKTKMLEPPPPVLLKHGGERSASTLEVLPSPSPGAEAKGGDGDKAQQLEPPGLLKHADSSTPTLEVPLTPSPGVESPAGAEVVQKGAVESPGPASPGALSPAVVQPHDEETRSSKP